MKNPVHLGSDIYMFRGYPVFVKKYKENIVNIIFHSDTQKKFEPTSDLLSTSYFINESDKVSLGEIALQCENKYIIAICKKTGYYTDKYGKQKPNYNGMHITIIPENVYTNEYTKTKNSESKTDFELSIEELNAIQDEYF